MRGTRITIPDLTKRVGTEEMTITEVVFGNTRPKVATMRTDSSSSRHGNQTSSPKSGEGKRHGEDRRSLETDREKR